MKSLVLKKPSACCGSPTLLWDKVKGFFACPCGVLRVNERGLPVRHLVPFKGARIKGKHHKPRLGEEGEFR